MSLLDDFVIRALLAGVALAAAAAPLGCFVVWRRMAYFGDATAHAALLGVAVSLLADAPLPFGAAAVAAIMALAVSASARHAGRGGRYAPDTILGVAAHGALALGLVGLALAPGGQARLHSFLMGDLLAVSRMDVAVIWAAAAALGAYLWARWPQLLTSALSPELAAAEGVPVRRENTIFLLALALFAAAAMKIVGALLVTAFLIIPAAAARPLARTPEGMARLAMALGALAVLLGMGGSYAADSPTGPSIVAAAAFLFVVCNLIAKIVAPQH